MNQSSHFCCSYEFKKLAEKSMPADKRWAVFLLFLLMLSLHQKKKNCEINLHDRTSFALTMSKNYIGIG